MTLYKADFLEAVGVPVPKNGKGKKRAIEPETPPVTPERPTESGKQLPVKKPKTEKQLAALERARENRQRKKEAEKAAKEAELKAVEDAKKAVADKEAEIEKKKLERKEKRAAKKVKVEESVSDELDKVIEEVVKPKKVRKKKVVDENEPPAWFKKFIEGQHIEKNELSKEKKPPAVIKKESKQAANSAWQDDMTRDRVNQERDNHMARMYSSIFGSRLGA